MSQSSKSGKAFEYAIALTIFDKLHHLCDVKIIENNAFMTAKKDFLSFVTTERLTYMLAAEKIINHILILEPLLIENNFEKIEIRIQTDSKGGEGDPRDVVIFSKEWEIGFSVKNNNDFSIKSPRLSKTSNFSDKWTGIPASSKYMKKIFEIFEELESDKSPKIINWNQLKDKRKNYFYDKILDIFIDELCNLTTHNPNFASKIIAYLVGNKDFYMLLKDDHTIEIRGFNLSDTLNKPSKDSRLKIKLCRVKLPTRIIEVTKISTNKIQITFDKGWQLSFRIHNAETDIKPSVKLEVGTIGIPPSIYRHIDNL